jgi:hypothetical protein
LTISTATTSTTTSSIGVASAGANQEPKAKEPPTAQATEALAIRLTNEAFGAADEGRANPNGGERTDCPSAAKNSRPQARGIDKVSCVEERGTPPSPGLIDKFMAGQEQAPLPETVPMANFPAPSGSGQMQVNGLEEYGQLQQAIHPDFLARDHFEERRTPGGRGRRLLAGTGGHSS